ncbi:UNVERIFIED_CONTAM: Calmodulin-binding transcription activator 2 [Sesamum calycinum]|uniref:Calmodulin-binding transcription activator 2 n=1 Tax=Sesamum calycinum TaxID=2727403 RepID=A0AAW2KTU5_9LAMI
MSTLGMQMDGLPFCVQRTTEAPEALTDPTPKYPAGRPLAELAANNGHKGIAAGYGDLPHVMSMKGSLAFVRNAMQLKLQLAFIEFSEYSGSRESSKKSTVMAHVRGHQVRRNYGKIIWSVGILDKVVLRWRWKRRRLSRFRPEALGAGISMVDAKRKEDDYYFLKEGRKGRKQTEGRLQNALARLTSIVQYSKARDQHRWLLNVV